MTNHILGFLPLNGGYWKATESTSWEGLNYLETILNFSDLPPNTYGKLFVEWADDSPKQPGEHRLSVRVSYQQEIGVKVPLLGSEITKTVNKRWQLDESDWFKIPTEIERPALFWIEGRIHEGGRCAVALANIMLVTRDE